jgi:hypothetical protein
MEGSFKTLEDLGRPWKTLEDLGLRPNPETFKKVSSKL